MTTTLLVGLVWANDIGVTLDFSENANAANLTVDLINPACVVNDGVVVAPKPGENCNIQPNVQTISVHRLALCTTKPSSPGENLASDLSACSFIFESSQQNGSAVNILLDQVSLISDGKFTKPSNGTYTHLYVELSPEVQIKAAVKFSTDMADENGTTSGQFCWTNAINDEPLYGYSMNESDKMPEATKCGDALPEMADIKASKNYYNSLGGPTFSHAYTNLPTTLGGSNSLDAYLIDDNNHLAMTQKINENISVSKLSAVMLLPDPGVTITDASRRVVLGYNNAKGAQITTQTTDQNQPISRITKFGNGPFDMTVVVE